MNFINSIAKNSNFACFLQIFDEFFSGFRAKFQKLVTCVAFSIKFAKTDQKFAENSEFCEKKIKKFTVIQNYSLHSLGSSMTFGAPRTAARRGQQLPQQQRGARATRRLPSFSKAMRICSGASPSRKPWRTFGGPPIAA